VATHETGNLLLGGYVPHTGVTVAARNRQVRSVGAEGHTDDLPALGRLHGPPHLFSAGQTAQDHGPIHVAYGLQPSVGAHGKGRYSPGPGRRALKDVDPGGRRHLVTQASVAAELPHHGCPIQAAGVEPPCIRAEGHL
jgi:hypothetical protein